MLHSSPARGSASAASSAPQPGQHVEAATSSSDTSQGTRSRDSLEREYGSDSLKPPAMQPTEPISLHQQQQQEEQQSLPPPPATQSFYQRYFTKQDDSSSDTEKKTDSRHFSLLAIGSIVSTVMVLLVFAGIIAAAVALSVRKPRPADEGSDKHEAPIRLAIPFNFPDPGLLYDNGTYYAFATTNAAGVLNYPDKANNASQYTVDFGLANVQLATSTNFVNWTVAPLSAQPLPAEGKWTQLAQKAANPAKVTKPKISSTWAPAVIRRADGKFIMYYSAAPGFKVSYKVNHPHPHCIGAAVSTGDSPAGPYEPLPESLTCPWEQGGAIDPEAFRDPSNGKLYLVYKIDGNNIGSGGACGNTVSPIQKTPIMLQEMADDAVTKAGEPIEIFTNEKQDGPLVEAPVLAQSPEGLYFLFFSSGCTRLDTYALEYATATHIRGPYTRVDKKLLKTGDWGLEAPGSVGIAEDGNGGWSMAFHARVNYGEVGRVRAMFTTKLKFAGTQVCMERDEETVDLQQHDSE
ncbi:hypothetical protein CLAFUW4_13267 [Fulvia fulva]|uniref:Uncharacterized protein n=1 Tax=Passalora fulva TaxID=5499 RepID=A0A9Q8PIV3_PASFU|nr:uncharacterized protein CLAFUR5_13123 [Fulvia fulva]KAK4612103.1 hypothetical protein CLAFUR4_13272 [Fulvia fulva]KAK4612872.1 hypothetical protein CLAFUR0_13277 [Fulvia fulva]UJO23295.1 hypothetical protein CLAFUR5_13123 [Fulvia fulva]WPV21473.1 hypothetical protein CLAFUW4_13267 [Fulvia fulva]WPV35777.1 hypothetical protein CLAFUW7_13274 [Fulvia fulva]